MVIYSIKDIEEITGIKAHTLRIWEKRYGIIVPKRTDTNIRYYTDDDLNKIIKISLLNKKGIKISHIAKLSPEDLKNKFAQYNDGDASIEEQLDALGLAVINLDEVCVNRIIDNYISQIGFLETMDLLINPFLEKMSALWISGSIKSIHESFISEILKQKTIRQIQDCNVAIKKDSPTFLLYLPESEKQELSILYFKFLLKQRGIKSVVVGFDLTLNDVIEAYAIIKPDYIYSILNEDMEKIDFSAYIQFLCKSIGDTKMILTGFKAISLGNMVPENCVPLNTLNDAISYLDNLQI